MKKPLISVIELMEAIQQSDNLVRIIDCRHNLDFPDAARIAYLDAHLPGAQFLHLDNDLSGDLTGTNGRHPLPEVSKLIAKLSSIGLSRDSKIVMYDEGNGSMAAARAWWMLSEWLGFNTVYLLDGGLAEWCKRGGELSNIIPTNISTDLSDISARQVTVDVDYVQSKLNSDELRIVDARAPERYAGIGERRARVGGHIPGAFNRWFCENLRKDGLFKSPNELKNEWNKVLNGKKSNEVIMYCGSGVVACHNLFSMKLAGLNGARLYTGSWSEWASDPIRHVVNSSEA